MAITLCSNNSAALGPNKTLEVERVIHETRKRGTAIILISHNLDQVFRVADRLVVVHKGVTSREFLRSEVTLEELVKSITTG